MRLHSTACRKGLHMAGCRPESAADGWFIDAAVHALLDSEIP